MTDIAGQDNNALHDAACPRCDRSLLREIVSDVEAEIEIPVTSFDHAMAWRCLRLAAVKDVVPGAGRLFELA